MRIALVARPLGGGTTVGLCVAKALASLRGGIRPAKIRVITLSDTTGPVLAPWRVDPVRAASLAQLEEGVRAAAGAVAIVDDMSDVRTLAREGYQEAVNEERERLGQRPIEGIMPSGWSAIAARVEQATWRAAADVGADLIELWNRSAGYTRDPDLGLMETSGVRTRGQVEGPAGIGLILQISEGGLRSSGEIGDRVLAIAADPSGQANGASISLPEIRSGRDRLEVLARVRLLVSPVLKRCITLADAEAAAWAAAPMVADEWPEASAHVQGEEAKRGLEEVAVLFLEAGLDGQKGEAQRARKRILVKAWGVTKTEMLTSLTLKDLQDGMSTLRAGVEEFKANMRNAESLVRAPRESSFEARRDVVTLQSIFRQFDISEAGQRRLLMQHANVHSLKEFAALPENQVAVALEAITKELDSYSTT